MPYIALGITGHDATVLKQNTGIQAGVLKALEETRRIHGDLAVLKSKHAGTWNQLVSKVDQIVPSGEGRFRP